MPSRDQNVKKFSCENHSHFNAGEALATTPDTVIPVRAVYPQCQSDLAAFLGNWGAR